MADPTVLEVYRREITPQLYSEIRELYKTHSIAEDARDLPGLISTLTPGCVYELRYRPRDCPVARSSFIGPASITYWPPNRITIR